MSSFILSIVIPVYNEEKVIAQVINDHVELLSAGIVAGDWEIICLDDASTDGSLRILEAKAKEIPQLRVIRHTQNKGIYESFTRLFKEAKGKYIYATGGDGQWPAENCRRLWNRLEETSADVVIGVRTNRHMVYGVWRRILSYCFNAIPQLLFGIKLKDANGIKLGRREIFQEQLMSRSFFGEIERLIRAKDKGLSIDFSPIEFLSRSTGKAKGAKWGNILNTLRDILKYSFIRKNNLFGFIAFLVFIIFIGIGCYLAAHKSLWLDERYSLLSSTLGSSYWKILSGGVQEGNNSPLFYLLQRLQCDLFSYRPPVEWVNGNWGFHISYSQLFLRGQAVLCVAFMLSVIFYYFSINYSILAGINGLAIALTSFMVWDHWVEARPYPLLLLLTTLQMFVLMDILKYKEQLKYKRRLLAGIHILLALTASISVVQIVACSMTVLIFLDRNWKSFVGLLALPVSICMFYYFLGPHYGFYFKDGPIALISSNIPKDRFVLIISSLLIGLLYRMKKEQLRRLWECKLLFFISLILLFYAMILIGLKLKIGNSTEGFPISGRYFIALTSIGIVGATLYSVFLLERLKSNWALFLAGLVLMAFLIIRLFRVVPFIHVG